VAVTIATPNSRSMGAGLRHCNRLESSFCR